MKMCYGNVPIKSLNVHHYELSTQDSNLQPSDMQAGIIAYGRGKKIIGTGKAFEFADYGGIYTNFSLDIPSMINVIEIASTSYPIKTKIEFSNMKNIDFATSQNIGSVIIDNIEYPVILNIQDNLLTLSCEQTLWLQVFYGKDNYI